MWRLGDLDRLRFLRLYDLDRDLDRLECLETGERDLDGSRMTGFSSIFRSLISFWYKGFREYSDNWLLLVSIDWRAVKAIWSAGSRFKTTSSFSIAAFHRSFPAKLKSVNEYDNYAEDSCIRASMKLESSSIECWHILMALSYSPPMMARLASTKVETAQCLFCFTRKISK